MSVLRVESARLCVFQINYCWLQSNMHTTNATFSYFLLLSIDVYPLSANTSIDQVRHCVCSLNWSSMLPLMECTSAHCLYLR